MVVKKERVLKTREGVRQQMSRLDYNVEINKSLRDAGDHGEQHCQ